MMKNGFTLIELLIVVSIIGLLSAIAIPKYSQFLIHAKIASTHQRLAFIQSANNLYRLDYGTYLPFENYKANDKAWDQLDEYIDLSLVQDPFSYTTSNTIELFIAYDTPTFDHVFDYSPGLAERYYKGSERRNRGGDSTAYYPMSDTFLIDGVGPNQIDDIVSKCFALGCITNSKPGRFITRYDTSNGLMSKGDIYKIGGNSPPGFNALFD